MKANLNYINNINRDDLEKIGPYFKIKKGPIEKNYPTKEDIISISDATKITLQINDTINAAYDDLKKASEDFYSKNKSVTIKGRNECYKKDLKEAIKINIGPENVTSETANQISVFKLMTTLLSKLDEYKIELSNDKLDTNDYQEIEFELKTLINTNKELDDIVLKHFSDNKVDLDEYKKGNLFLNSVINCENS